MLEKRKYNAIDIIRLTYKCAPVSLLLLLFLTIIDAIVPTSLMALSTAFFVDTAITVLEGNEPYFNIFFHWCV